MSGCPWASQDYATGRIDRWHVASTGDPARDRRLGQHYALMAIDQGASHWVLGSLAGMILKGHLGDIERAFLEVVSEHATQEARKRSEKRPRQRPRGSGRGGRPRQVYP